MRSSFAVSPAGQAVQSSGPSCLVTSRIPLPTPSVLAAPRGQYSHSAVPSFGAIVPGPQTSHWVASAVLLKVPTGHGMQPELSELV